MSEPSCLFIYVAMGELTTLSQTSRDPRRYLGTESCETVLGVTIPNHFDERFWLRRIIMTKTIF